MREPLTEVPGLPGPWHESPLFRPRAKKNRRANVPGGHPCLGLSEAAAIRTSYDQLEPGPNYANSSLITLPLLAIFIGRPFLLVNVVSSEMPRALQTVAIRSCDV